MGIVMRLLDWLDRKNWTPEMRAILSAPPASGSSRFDIYAATPTGNIPVGHKLGTVVADSVEGALETWAGSTPYELIGGNRVRFRERDEVVAVPEGTSVSLGPG